jgi:hypothetical protein
MSVSFDRGLDESEGLEDGVIGGDEDVWEGPPAQGVHEVTGLTIPSFLLGRG